MGGSQLTKLKEALSQAGLNRKPPAGKKRKRESKDSLDNDKRAQKLDAIKQKLNPFDTTYTKLKHDVGGRKIKGVTGNPQQSKQAGIELRKKTLLKEHKLKNHAGTIIDRRIGENDPTMTPEERMLERFTKERQRSSKGAAFNLEDEDELTHYGQSLSKLDDFDGVGLGLRDDDDEDDGNIDQATVKHAHFGGFEDDDEDGEEPARKKSKADVMAEVIAKSKHHKFERQLERQQNDATRLQLDDELDGIRELLFEAGADDKATKALMRSEDKDYDVNVKELVLEKRATPKDRTKTEEELALEAKEALEKAERKRLRRMNGEDWDSSDDDAPSRKKEKRSAEADDLEDDFQQEDGADWGGLGEGLVSGGKLEQKNNADEEEGSEEGDEDESGSEEDSSNSDEDEVDMHEDKQLTSLSTKKSSSSGKTKKGSAKDLPFTFPCPKSNDEFLSIIEDIPEVNVPVVIQRIRALHHPSLAEGNKFKLQALTGVLIDYILHVTSPPEPNFALVPLIIHHLHALSDSYPVESATHFVSKLKLMQKNLTRGLAQGPMSSKSRTWPGPCELAFLWTISDIWSTSDMNHPVVSPARLLMGSYLGLCRVRSLSDIASGIFLCNLFRRYEELSKRFVPEVPNFLLSAVLFLAPHRFKDYDSLPGFIFCPDFDSDKCRALKLTKQNLQTLQPQLPSLAQVLDLTPSDVEQHKVNLLGTALELVGQFADMYRGLDGNVEILCPMLEVLNGLKLDVATEALKSKLASKIDMVTRLMKFASEERRPLQLQQHKPIPIATYIPKFENQTSSYLRRNDPDHERAEASKLRYQYKQERKGAIRELRKDAKFMAVVKHKDQEEKDRVYKDKMNRLQASMENEQAEHKKLDKEKLREKNRAGRK